MVIPDLEATMVCDCESIEWANFEYGADETGALKFVTVAIT